MENAAKPAMLSVEVQQALGKLNVRLADLMEQINLVIKVLVEENVALRAKLSQVQVQQFKEDIKK